MLMNNNQAVYIILPLLFYWFLSWYQSSVFPTSLTMATSSTTTPNNPEQTQHYLGMNNPQLKLSFANTIKLGRTNYLMWKTQALASIRTNAVEGLIDGSNPPPSRITVQSNGGQQPFRIQLSKFGKNKIKL